MIRKKIVPIIVIVIVVILLILIIVAIINKESEFDKKVDLLSLQLLQSEEIEDLDIIGGYLFIYLKDPQSYYLKKFKGNVISEDPLYIYLADLDISSSFIKSMFEFFYNTYKDDEDDNNCNDEDDYKKYYRDYY